MKRLVLFGALFFIAPFIYAQEICDNGIDDDADGLIDLNDPECDCAGLGIAPAVTSLIPNPSFEDNTCCPTMVSELYCADDWIQASDATSDYLSSCAGFNSLIPFGDPALPPPGGGESYAGFHNSGTYKEYIGACLTSPMLAGTPYVLNLWVANSTGGTDITFSLFGATTCADLPWAGFDCPIGSGSWMLLDDAYVVTAPAPGGAWSEVTLTFTPTVDIYAVAMGGSCTADPGTNYFFVDELTLIDSMTFAGGSIYQTGNWCDADLALNADIDTVGGAWQWYYEGVALPGETGPTLDVMATGPGTYQAVYTLGGECDEQTYTLTIPDAPVADFSFTNQCYPNGINFLDNSAVTSGSISDWDWDFGDASGTSTDANPTYTYSAPGTYTVDLTVTSDSGCINTASYDVTIYPKPNADFEFIIDGVSSTTGLTGGCLGEEVSLVNNSTVTPPDVLSITNWDFGDGNTSALSAPTHTYTAEGSYTIELAVESNNGCQDTIQIPIDIFPIPTAAFTVNPVCAYDDAVFTNTSTVSSGIISASEWDFDDLSPLDVTPSPTHNYTAGIYNPTLVVFSDNGCSDTVSVPLTIYEIPVADFTTTDMCNGETSSFTDASTITSGTISAWSWDFGDGSPLDPATNPTHLYAATGAYGVTLTVTSDNGCIDDTTITHNITSNPTADFTFTDNICEDIDASFTDLSIVPGGSVSDWEWDFGDSSPFSTVEDPSHTYPGEGTYNVTLVVFAGSVNCADTITQTINIQPLPTANFTTADICQDVTAEFFDNSIISSGALSWEWDFGDSSPFSSLENPTHDYASEGLYDVTLTVTSPFGCEDDITQPINIFAVPTADFTTNTVCENTPPTNFTNNSTISAGAITGYSWDFGDGNTGTGSGPSHSYGTSGSFNAELTVTSDNGCTSTIIVPVNVHEKPTALFTSADPMICNPDCIPFYDNSYSASATISAWAWDFGSGGIQTGMNPTPCFQHTSEFTEYYDVTLIATNDLGCSDTITSEDYVAVMPTPVAEFSFSPQVITIEDPRVFFTNNSQMASTYSWDFGDGSPISSEIDPENTYPEVPGQYLVELDAYSEGGICHDSTTQLVIVEDVIIFYVPNVFTPDGDEFNETFQPKFLSGYDPYDFHMTIYNRWGEIIFETYNASYGWNGTYGDRGLVDDGTYIWDIEFKETMSDKSHRHRGHVTILK
ncbi:MAG: PKD domain-containing protein [Flavobacteriales bacterium]|nr:PKD domain-containing protein [Flavobacteriales bacterium]